jgi:hypothetical protein
VKVNNAREKKTKIIYHRMLRLTLEILTKVSEEDTIRSFEILNQVNSLLFIPKFRVVF